MIVYVVVTKPSYYAKAKDGVDVVGVFESESSAKRIAQKLNEIFEGRIAVVVHSAFFPKPRMLDVPESGIKSPYEKILDKAESEV